MNESEIRNAALKEAIKAVGQLADRVRPYIGSARDVLLYEQVMNVIAALKSSPAPEPEKAEGAEGVEDPRKFCRPGESPADCIRRLNADRHRMSLEKAELQSELTRLRSALEGKGV